MTRPVRLLDLGQVPPLHSQALYHGLAEAMTPDSPDTIALLTPSAPYFCVGFHQNAAEELDLGWCRRHGYPVLQRLIGGGTVYLDENQLFYQCVFHRSRVPFRVDAIYQTFLRAPVETLRALGVDASLHDVNELEISGRRIAGTGGGQLGEAVVVTGNLLFDFDYDAMARGWRVPSEAFRQLAADGLRRYVTTLKRELPHPPSREEAKRLLSDSYAETLGRPLVAGALSVAEEDAIARAAARLAAAGSRRAAALATARRGQRHGRLRTRLKVTGRVVVHERSWPTSAGDLRVTARVANGEIEDLVLSGDGALDRDEVERCVRGAPVWESAQ